MTADELIERERELFDAMIGVPGDSTFKDALYRDGVPRPDIYLSQPVRVLFVFREANLSGNARVVDMRAEVCDEEYRQSRDGRLGTPASDHSWWNERVAAYGHAVANALAGTPASFASVRALVTSSQRPRPTHDWLFPFGFIQIKKVGGAGLSKSAEIRHHARMYARFLRSQIAIYEPHLIVGCGKGDASPAKLLSEYVLRGGERHDLSTVDLCWWQYAADQRPTAMVEVEHPSLGSLADKYERVWSAVRELTTLVPVLKVAEKRPSVPILRRHK